MAKKIKFTLEMKDGVQARTLEDLQENFDMEKVVGYFTDGKLQTWLEERYYEDEAEAVSALSKDDVNFQKKLCDILGVVTDEINAIDIEEVEQRKKRLEHLRQYTADENILKKIDYVAFDQEELGELLTDGVSEVILCNNSFRIPLKQKNKKYIGVGRVEVIIKSSEKIDFNAMGISFFNIKFDSEYEKIDHNLTAEDLFEKAVSCEDEDEKVSLLKEAVEKGSTKAMVELGSIYVKNNLDKEYGIELLEEAAEQGEVEANNALGWLYYYGEYVAENHSKALDNFKASKEHNSADGYLGMGHLYSEGFYGEPDIDSAEKCYQKSAELGEKWAMYSLGKLYQNNEECEKAIVYYKKALEAGMEDVLNDIGDCYLFGKGIANDEKEAVVWYKKGANKGNKESMYAMGLIHLNSDCLQDYKKAMYWFEKAAGEGVTNAKTCIGEMYENGLGVPKSVEKALEYYRDAADEDDVEAMCNIGIIYDEGNDVKRDYWEAINWYKEAAKREDKKAYRLIGRLYYNGNGVEKDLKKACMWWVRSCDAGDSVAKRWLEECF